MTEPTAEERAKKITYEIFGFQREDHVPAYIEATADEIRAAEQAARKAALEEVITIETMMQIHPGQWFEFVESLGLPRSLKADTNEYEARRRVLRRLTEKPAAIRGIGEGGCDESPRS
jgi:hypothetical protein